MKSRVKTLEYKVRLNTPEVKYNVVHEPAIIGLAQHQPFSVNMSDIGQSTFKSGRTGNTVLLKYSMATWLMDHNSVWVGIVYAKNGITPTPSDFIMNVSGVAVTPPQRENYIVKKWINIPEVADGNFRTGGRLSIKYPYGGHKQHFEGSGGANFTTGTYFLTFINLDTIAAGGQFMIRTYYTDA